MLLCLQVISVNNVEKSEPYRRNACPEWECSIGLICDRIYPLIECSGILLGVGVSLIFIGLEKRIESVILPIKNILRR